MRQDWFDEAKHEFVEAARYYHWEQPGLEDDFVEEVGRAVSRIVVSPEVYREFDPPFRKAKTDRFPYQIVFIIDGENHPDRRSHASEPKARLLERAALNDCSNLRFQAFVSTPPIPGICVTPGMATGLAL